MYVHPQGEETSMSSHCQPFSTTFNKVTSRLKEEGQIGHVSTQFAKLQSDKERASFVLELEAVQQIICPVA